MKKIFIAAMAVMTACFSSAQESSEIVKCHTYEMQHELFTKNPHLKKEAESIRLDMLKRAQKIEGMGLEKDGDPYIIPIVFHIIHENGPENLAMSQIENAVEVMTNDFKANNFAIDNVQDAFVDIVGDVGIEFRLAQRDPNGDCTNGVVRTFSSITNEGGENLKEISPIWDRSKYMNIWVCKTIASGAAGYTYYPSTLAGDFGETNDGIVVRYDYVGSIGESNLGRSQTLTHEVGHWIDLPHLWGSTNEPSVESNCDTDDGVEDTPNTIGWTSCNVNGETCGSLDNVENFMEYSFCGKMFTEGQKARMISALTSSVAERNSLWSEENLVETGVLDEPELCNAEFTADRFSICVGGAINFQDQSFSTVIDRSWIFEGGFPSVSNSETPEVVYSVPGVYAVSLVASDSAGNQLTEVKENYIEVLDTASVALPFSEGFEGYDNLDQTEDGSFYTENFYGEDVWEVSQESASTGSRSAVFRATGASGPTIVKSAIVSKTFQLSDLMADPILTFKYAGAKSSLESNGELWVFISKNCGEFWSLRKRFDDGEAYTNQGLFPTGFVPGEGDWLSYQIDNIVPIFQNEEFRLRFEYRGTNGGTIYIDDINLVDGTTLNTAFQTDEDISFAMFPNPAKGFVNLTFPSDLLGLESILVRDLSGRAVKEESLQGGISNSEYQLVLSGFASGIYLIEVRSREGSSAKKLIVE